MIDNKTVGQAIAKLRLSENMTQQTLAACLNVSHQAVSKWEKGAALPDVLTLVELSRMFGVTLEQLLAGDVDFRVQGHEAKPEKTIELKLDYEDIRAKAERAAAEAEKAAESAHEDGKNADIHGATDADGNIDLDKIIEMAPFMSRAALDEIAMNYSGKCTPRQLSRIAPFLSKECLEKLVVNCESEINWDTLRRLAPFLRKEAVDAMTAAAAKGEKYTADISRSISKGLKKAFTFGEQIYHDTIKPGIKKVIEKEEKKPSPAPAVNRVSAARSRIFERALSEDRFDWIGEHIDQLEDEELKARVAARAQALGKTDWLEEYMDGYCDQESLDNAILNGDWDYLTAHIENANEDALALIADIAVSEENWGWLTENIETLAEYRDISAAMFAGALKAGNLDWIGKNIEFLELNDDDSNALIAYAAANARWDWLEVNMDFIEGGWADAKLALGAYQAGCKGLAERIVEEHLADSDLNELIEAAVTGGDMDFAGFLIENNGGDSGAVCINLARAGHLKEAAGFAEHLEPDAIAVLLDIAGEQGDWETIDALNDLLD